MIAKQLIKLSDPGWEFDGTHEQVRERLYQYICFQCRCEEGITEKSPIDQMLNTACGAEFMVEDVVVTQRDPDPNAFFQVPAGTKVKISWPDL